MVELWDFSAGWCPPCQQMEPLVEELEKEFAGKVSFKKIDVDNDPAEAAEFKVMSVPTFVLLKDGVEVDRKVGTLGKKAFREWVNQHL